MTFVGVILTYSSISMYKISTLCKVFIWFVFDFDIQLLPFIKDLPEAIDVGVCR